MVRSVVLALALVTLLAAGATADVRMAVPLGNSPRLGPANAPVTIVVFSDYGCSQCYVLENTLASLHELFPTAVAIVHRQFPLDDEWTLAAEAALAAAAQGRFAAMHARLFSVRGRVDRITVEGFARELGLDLLGFRTALDNGTYREAALADRADGAALGIRGTPALFVNGRVAFGRPTLATLIDWVAAAQDGRTAALPETPPTGELPPPPDDPGVQLGESYAVGLGLPGHQEGPAAALVTIVEWIDFECGFCARQAPVLRELLATRRDVRLVTRHLPLAMHSGAALAAEAAVEAARQGKLAAFTDALFAQRSRGRAALTDAARLAALDMPQFSRALETRRHRSAVLSEIRAAAQLGITGTPTLFFNGYPERGALVADALESVVQLHADIAERTVNTGLAGSDVYGLVTAMSVRREIGDPEHAPRVSGADIALRRHERVWSVLAGCRRFDAEPMKRLLPSLLASEKQLVTESCQAHGVAATM